MKYWLRRHLSGSATLMMEAGIASTLRFMREKADGFESLLTGEHEFAGQSGKTRPDFGWYAARWRGSPVEVVLSPHRGGRPGRAEIVCAAGSAGVLASFLESMHDFSMRLEGRCLRYGDGRWESAPDLEEEIGKICWDDIVLPPVTLTGIRESAEGFFDNRDAYASWGFAWRRGILLVVPPGTGKTMVCKAVAAALPKLPFLYVRETRGYDREPVGEIFERARKLTPCILAFEDMDGLVGKHNRTVFLNELDGFASNEGILVIASSNHPGRIDEALLKRPSRFDRVFHLGMPALEEREEYCRRLLSQDTLAGRLSADLGSDELAERMAAESEGFTLAYLTRRYSSPPLCAAPTRERRSWMTPSWTPPSKRPPSSALTSGVSGTRTPSPR